MADALRPQVLRLADNTEEGKRVIPTPLRYIYKMALLIIRCEAKKKNNFWLHLFFDGRKILHPKKRHYIFVRKSASRRKLFYSI